MAKSRKARPSTGSTTSQDTPPSPRAPWIANSTHSRSSLTRVPSAPIALRSASRKSAAAVVAPSLDATGEFTAVGGSGGEETTSSMMRRSRLVDISLYVAEVELTTS